MGNYHILRHSVYGKSIISAAHSITLAWFCIKESSWLTHNQHTDPSESPTIIHQHHEIIIFVMRKFFFWNLFSKHINQPLGCTTSRPYRCVIRYTVTHLSTYNVHVHVQLNLSHTSATGTYIHN